MLQQQIRRKVMGTTTKCHYTCFDENVFWGALSMKKVNHSSSCQDDASSEICWLLTVDRRLLSVANSPVVNPKIFSSEISAQMCSAMWCHAMLCSTFILHAHNTHPNSATMAAFGHFGYFVVNNEKFMLKLEFETIRSRIGRMVEIWIRVGDEQ